MTAFPPTPSVSSTPRVIGAALVVENSAALALLPINGMTISTQVYNLDTASFFQLLLSEEDLSDAVVAVAGVTGLRWIDSGPAGNRGIGWTSDSLLNLPNADGDEVVAAEDITALSTATAGSEASETILKFLKAGVQVVGVVISGDGIKVPQGNGFGLQFDAGAGALTGFGYDTLLPAVKIAINSTTRYYRLYQHALILDTANASGGFYIDANVSGGVEFSDSGTNVGIKAGTLIGLDCTVAGAIVWGRVVNSAAAVAAAKAVTINSSGLGIVADATTPTGCWGITIAGAGNGANLRFVRSGIAAGVLSSATPGVAYYLGTAGALTTTVNSTSGQANIKVGEAASATDLFVQISDRGINP